MMKNIGAVLMAVLVCGCTESSKPYRTAPVSGVVTLDGRPLAAARVTFMPVHESQGGSQSGPEASGETDDSGRYSLKTVFGDTGATVGKSRVMITTRKTELDPNNPDRSKEVAKERVPGRYFSEQSPLVFEVPEGGSKAANFELTTR
jgi:hypothetical protein